MSDIEIAINASELESLSDELFALKGQSFSHAMLAEAMWNDKFGGVSDPSIFGFGEGKNRDPSLSSKVWSSIKKEWYLLICTNDEKYDDLRKKVEDLNGKQATVIVSTISAVLASTLGLEAGLLLPFVTVFLHGIVTVGRNSLCAAVVPEEESTNG